MPYHLYWVQSLWNKEKDWNTERVKSSVTMEKFPKRLPSRTTSQPVYTSLPRDNSSERIITSPLSLPPPHDFASFRGLRELHSAPGFNDEPLPELISQSSDYSDDSWEDFDEEDLLEEMNSMIPFDLYTKILKERERKHDSDSDEESRWGHEKSWKSYCPYCNFP